MAKESAGPEIEKLLCSPRNFSLDFLIVTQGIEGSKKIVRGRKALETWGRSEIRPGLATGLARH